jgi:hypothetical protein
MMYTVYMKMENGIKVTWEGSADELGHAIGQAIAYATEMTGEQVYDYDCEEWEAV